jgi:hypothetical protein
MRTFPHTVSSNTYSTLYGGLVSNRHIMYISPILHALVAAVDDLPGTAPKLDLPPPSPHVGSATLFCSASARSFQSRTLLPAR